jgi:hypothetical protein
MRRTKEECDLKRAAALLEMHKVKGIPYDPAQDGFVFSNDQIEAYSLRLIRLNPLPRPAGPPVCQLNAINLA